MDHQPKPMKIGPLDTPQANAVRALIAHGSETANCGPPDGWNQVEVDVLFRRVGSTVKSRMVAMTFSRGDLYGDDGEHVEQLRILRDEVRKVYDRVVDALKGQEDE